MWLAKEYLTEDTFLQTQQYPYKPSGIEIKLIWQMIKFTVGYDLMLRFIRLFSVLPHN
jgi:hypothetical protein